LLVDYFDRRSANPCHEIAAHAGAHQGQGSSMVAGIMQAHGFLQLGELANDQRFDFGECALLHRVVSDRYFYIGDRGSARVNGIPVNFKIAGITGEEISALFALGDANEGYHPLEPAFELQCMVHHFLAGLRRDDEID
jgi:hypothetical protein